MYLGIYLRSYLDDVYEASQAHADEALLSFYVYEWDHYISAAKCIHRALRTLNRRLAELRRQRWEYLLIRGPKEDIYDVYNLYLAKWKEHFFMKVHNQVMDAVLNLIAKQRNGETIEQAHCSI